LHSSCTPEDIREFIKNCNLLILLVGRVGIEPTTY
jgi:hypothetical protein